MEPAAVKTGKAASIHVGIVTATKIPAYLIIYTTVDCAAWSHFDATSGHSETEVNNRLR